MRVGFDCTPLARPHPPGISRAAERTICELEGRGCLEIVRLSPPEGADLRSWRRHELPRAVAGRGLVGIHSFLSAFPWRGPGRRVQTIHELPWRHGVKENAGLRHRFWARLGPRRADAVITATEVTANELGLRRASAGGKLHVIPWGVDGAFQEEPPPGEVDEPLLDRYRLPGGPLCLCIGAVRAKKNLAALLAGVARLKEREGPVPHIVVTGPDTQDLRRDLGTAQKLGLARHVSTPGAVEEEHLPALYRLAAVVPVLSPSEGFSLPVLEALASGTPVVVPAGSAQAEVAGDLAFSCNTASPDSVADALRAAIEAREDLRYVLPDRAREFPWSRTAAGVEDIWSAFE